MRNDVRHLLCLLTKDNEHATMQLNEILISAVGEALSSHKSNPAVVSKTKSRFNQDNGPFCRYGGHFDFYCFNRKNRASGCHARGREFNSGRTNTQGLKTTEEKVLPL